MEELEANSIKLPEEKIGDKVDYLFKKSEKIVDFDLWEDHLKTKETTSILDEDTKIDDALSLEDEDSDVSAEENILEDNFVALEEDEILENFIEDNDFITEDVTDNITDDVEQLETQEIEGHDDELSDVMEETKSDEYESDLRDDITIEKSDEIFSEDETKKSVIDDIELELEQEELNDDGEGDEQEKEEEIAGECSESESPTNDDMIEDLNDENLHVEEQLDLEKEFQEEPLDVTKRKKRSPILLGLISAFLVVGAIGIYYLFFQSPTSEYQKYESKTETTLDESSDIDQNEIVKPEKIRELNESKPETIPPIEESNDKSSSQTLDDEKPSSEERKAVNNFEETEIGENIYYDGFVYNIQISSWKKREIAEKEVNGLINKGFPAFIIKIYIPKFDGIWHRVRIGPYNSLSEAKAVQNKIKK